VTLLTIVQSAAIRCGFATVPASAIGNMAGNEKENIQQLIAFVQDAGRELIERADWVNLDTAGMVIGDGVSTLFQLPQDWVRFSPSDKSPRGALVSNKYPLLPLQGPINTEDLNLLKALPVSTIRPVWRIIGGALEIWPALAGPPVPNPQNLPGELVTFSYYSSFWIMNAARTVSRAAWQSDDDFSLINEDTVMKGTVWRWKASKGLEYAEDFRAYEMSFARNAGQQMTERVVSTSRKYVIGDETYLGTITDLTSPIT
jgi:hypothetical protein